MTGTGTPLWLPSGGLGRSRERRGARVPVLVSCGLCNMATNSLVSDNRSFLSHDPRGQTCHLSFIRLRSSCLQGHAPTGGSRRESVPRLFQLLVATNDSCVSKWLPACASIPPNSACLHAASPLHALSPSLCRPFRRTLATASRAQLDNLSMSKFSV